MTSEQKKHIMLVVLVIIAIAVVVYQLVLAGGPATTTSTQRPERQTARTTAQRTPDVPTVTFQEVDVDIDELLEGIQVVTFDYSLERRSRNPLTPLVGAATMMAEEMTQTPQARMVDVLRMELSGIVWDEYDPFAVVDDMVVHVGYTFPDDIQVYAINPTNVVFLVGDALVRIDMEDL